MKMRALILILCLCTQQLCAQSRKISREDALQDFTIIRKSLEEINPGINRFGQYKQFAATCDSVRQVLSNQPDSIQPVRFFRIVNPALAKVKCGHLKFFPPMKDFPFYYHTDQLLPFIVRFDAGGKLLIVRAANPELRGKWISAINGKPIREVLATLRQNMFVDGDIINSADAQIQQYFSGWYADFIQESGAFSVILETFAGEKQEFNLTGIDLESWKKLNSEVPQLSDKNELSFKSDSVAYLRIAHFYANSNKEFLRFLDQSFETINKRGTQKLIVDVRGNEGGNDALGKALISYIARAPFHYYDRIELKVDRKRAITYREYAHIPRFSGLARLFTKKQKNGTLTWTKHQNLGQHKPDRNAFKGEVVFLADGLSYSVTAEALAVASNLPHVTIIGTESGGTYEGNNSGTFLIFKLPGSKFDFATPVATYYMKVEAAMQQARGVIPEYEIRATAEDLLHSRDAALEFALKPFRVALSVD